MIVAAIVGLATVLVAANPGANLFKADLQQVVKAEILASSAVARQNNADIVCVREKFAPPLRFSELATSGRWVSRSDTLVDRRIKMALGTVFHVKSVKSLATVPAISVALPDQLTPRGHILRFVHLSSHSPVQLDCVVRRSIIQPPAPSIRPYVLTLTRPVYVNGFVFIRESFDCPGLCGSGETRVFEKRKGKWTQVAERDFWVS